MQVLQPPQGESRHVVACHLGARSFAGRTGKACYTAVRRILGLQEFWPEVVAAVCWRVQPGCALDTQNAPDAQPEDALGNAKFFGRAPIARGWPSLPSCHTIHLAQSNLGMCRRTVEDRVSNMLYDWNSACSGNVCGLGDILPRLFFYTTRMTDEQIKRTLEFLTGALVVGWSWPIHFFDIKAIGSQYLAGV